MKKAYLLFLPVTIFFGSVAMAQPGIINTVAGDGLAGFAGDGTSAITAKFDTMQFIAVDDSENIYVADAQNNRIRKVYKTTGIIATIAGTGTPGWTGDYGAAVHAEIYYPVAIALDNASNIYFTDNGNGIVRKITKSTGVINTIAGDGNGGNTGDDSLATKATFLSPEGIAVDNAGNVYVGDAGNNRIRVIRSDNNIYAYAGSGAKGYAGDGGPAIAAEMNTPLGITVDNNGNLYIADWLNDVVRKVDNSGNITTFAGIAGNNAATNATGPATAVPISSPTDVKCDVSGNVYISDVGTSIIREVNVSTNIGVAVAGNTISGFGGDGGQALAAELQYPLGVAVDNSSNIYIEDLLNFRVREVNSYIVGIENILASGKFAVYPNPANSNLTIVFPDNYNASNNALEILDVTGRSIVNSPLTIHNSQMSVDVSTLPSGMYFIKIGNGNSSQLEKFIKE
ncbi:MAG TPA: T9SS type A sorting domain-containing protein [Bacteroidia bacterium]|jgi:sugar lactone lactonase YvrE|nr:T9SS type A sorting domain-containing protein [Bacteroidia bacterium]